MVASSSLNTWMGGRLLSSTLLEKSLNQVSSHLLFSAIVDVFGRLVSDPPESQELLKRMLCQAVMWSSGDVCHQKSLVDE